MRRGPPIGTYIATAKGWQFLAVVLSVASRKVVGWSMSALNDEELTMAALNMALALRPSPELQHSDRGVQYTSDAYQLLLADHRIASSMSRLGNCWDNAVVESFFSTVKTEAIRGQIFADHESAKALLMSYLGFYNLKRRHSALG